VSITLQWMLKNGVELTTANFVRLNWFGQYKSSRQLEGEERIELWDFQEQVRKLRRKQRRVK